MCSSDKLPYSHCCSPTYCSSLHAQQDREDRSKPSMPFPRLEILLLLQATPLLVNAQAIRCISHAHAQLLHAIAMLGSQILALLSVAMALGEVM